MSDPSSSSFVYPVKSLLTNIQSASDDVKESAGEKPIRSSPKRKKRRASKNPNFSHFPSERNIEVIPSFSSTSGSVPPTPSHNLDWIDTVSDDLVHLESSEFDPRHPASLTSVSSNAFLSTSDSLLPHEKDPSLPWNPAELGIVHLPLESLSSRSGSQSNSTGPSINGGSIIGSSRQAQASGTDPKSDADASSSQSGSSSSVGFSSDSQNVSVEFRHLEDENGHYVIIGREGKLVRCDDEPIRTPGAVQAFGVLIAVDEREDALVVRQVSENAHELLGLSPRYLFSLECFTDTLPDSQASLLWDNIQYLAEPDPTCTDDEQDFPHVFLISGWGEPQPEGRREWTCWCAVHRPPPTPECSRNIIIMEFEFERDTLNPLYPPSSLPQEASGTQRSTSRQTSGGERGTGTDASDWITTLTPATPPEDEIAIARSAADPDTTPIASKNHPTPKALPQSPVAESKLAISALTTNLAEEGNGEIEWAPSAEDIMESTTSRSKPLPALERLRRMSRAYGGYQSSSPGESTSSPQTTRQRRNRGANNVSARGVGMMDVFAVMAQINEQLGAAPDLNTFLQVLVGVIKDLTQFHRVIVYQFDEFWNGKVVAELVDWNMTQDLFKGLHFPAGDIPAQARQLYTISKVRILYDRSQTVARLVARTRDDLDTPLDMTHCYLRAMSPIHIKYLGNMGVRASMSVSIMAFGALWGLVACHSYGAHGMRVSFPVRQMLKLLSQSISRNIERLSYAQRLHTRKLINTISSENHPTGYIVSDADDLLTLFDADFGILVIGEGAKILGPNEHGQEILIMAEYLRLKQFDTIQVSQAVVGDFPDLQLSTGLEVLAGLLYVPLSSGGKDFIAFLRRGQPRNVHWAGKPQTSGKGPNSLEPRSSFKIWSERVAGRCRVWTDEQLETAGVLALVYGKFIEVWRQKQEALQTNKLTNLLLSNARHEVRTPLNHIINYLEMALNGPLDLETRDNLSRSHAASKSLLFTINDLLDLTRLERGNETSFYEAFELSRTIEEAVYSYRNEAERRHIAFVLDIANCPQVAIGDAKKIRTVVQNLTANALKYTKTGAITVRCTTLDEPEGLRSPKQTAVEIVVEDTGCGISTVKLQSIFREFEQVEMSQPATTSEPGVGLGLAVVARSVAQLGGQLRVESKVNQGSRFSFLIPLTLYEDSDMSSQSRSSNSSSVQSLLIPSRSPSVHSSGNEIDSLVEALSSSHMLLDGIKQPSPPPEDQRLSIARSVSQLGTFEVMDSGTPVRPVKIDTFEDKSSPKKHSFALSNSSRTSSYSRIPTLSRSSTSNHVPTLTRSTSSQQVPTISRSSTIAEIPIHKGLKILIVEDNEINRSILAKRLTKDGHVVVNAVNGQEGVDIIRSDRQFDCILMDINMPILNGFESTSKIRELENSSPKAIPQRISQLTNGRIPIFAVSASLVESQRDQLIKCGMDGWILKPIDYKRLNVILKGVTDEPQRESDMYRPGFNWELGGWLRKHSPG